EVLLAKAKAAGYDRDPEIRSRVDEFIVARFQEDQLIGHVAPTAPDEAELRIFYEQNKERFTAPGSVRAAVIYFSCSSKAEDEKREAIKHKAEAVLAESRATDAEGFSRLALQHSDDQATRYTGGDAGWLQSDAALPRWHTDVMHAAF